MDFLVILFGVLLIFAVARLILFAVRNRPRRPRESGFEYVYIEDNGRVRELSLDEREYLTADYEFGDGNRPYIKSYWEYLTPDGKMRGFIRRRQVPKSISIKPAE